MPARSMLGWRWLALLALGILAISLYMRILAVAGLVANQADLFTLPELGALAVAVVAAALVLASRPAATPRQRAIELALLLGFGVAFRAVFFAATPTLSHDAYRYVWDAHLLANGLSPWTHALSDPALAPLRDSAIWPQVNWRSSPTIYPPGAQLVFLLVNAVAPLSIAAMKWAMTLTDFAVGALTLVLLRQRGQDLRRVVVYWWNPLPIVEFTFNAHMDALATLWTLASLGVLARDTQSARATRAVAGVLLGLAAATKLYPLLFAVALLRPVSQTNFRRQRLADPLLFALGATLVLVYVPFAFIGLGNGGFLATYFGQRFIDQGILFRLITTVFISTPLQVALQTLALVALCGLVAWLRIRRVLDPTAGVLAISATWIVLSPHLFPWYVAGLLPLLALHLRPIRLRAWLPVSHVERRFGDDVYPLALYLFALAMPFTYVIFAPGHDANLFAWFFYIPLVAAASPWIARATALAYNRASKRLMHTGGSYPHIPAAPGSLPLRPSRAMGVGAQPAAPAGLSTPPHHPPKE